jgi:hypothetical protein
MGGNRFSHTWSHIILLAILTSRAKWPFSDFTQVLLDILQICFVCLFVLPLHPLSLIISLIVSHYLPSSSLPSSTESQIAHFTSAYISPNLIICHILLQLRLEIQFLMGEGMRACVYSLNSFYERNRTNVLENLRFMFQGTRVRAGLPLDFIILLNNSVLDHWGKKGNYGKCWESTYILKV